MAPEAIAVVIYLLGYTYLFLYIFTLNNNEINSLTGPDEQM